MHGGSTGLIAAGMLSSSPSKTHMITIGYSKNAKKKLCKMYQNLRYKIA